MCLSLDSAAPGLLSGSAAHPCHLLYEGMRISFNGSINSRCPFSTPTSARSWGWTRPSACLTIISHSVCATGSDRLDGARHFIEINQTDPPTRVARMHDHRMNGKAESMPLLSRLTKAALIIVATFCGDSSAAVADRALDETAQLNSFDSRVESNLSTRRTMTVVAGKAISETRVERGEPLDQQLTAASLADGSVEFLTDPSQFMMPRTSFGAGSIALSALGQSAARPYSR